MSSMSSLYIGVSGLSSSQNSLNVTAHNLANVDTSGYVRQQVLSEDSTYRKIGESYNSSMQTGLGTSIDMIRQVRDNFLDKSYRQELGREGFYKAQYETVQEIEGLFGELEGVAFQDTLETMWTSIQELAKEPDSIVKRSALIENSVSFIERASNISTQLKDYQINLNTQIIDKVDRINEIGDRIYELNDKIIQYESTGLEQANDYRDERNALLDELGQMVKISYKENASGVVTVSAEESPFVTDFTTYHMMTEKMNDDSNMLKPVWKSTGIDVFDLTSATSTENNTDIGSLKGLLVARGDSIANYTDIPIAPVQTDYPDLASYNLALTQYTDEVAEYENRVDSSVVMSTQAKFDQLIHGLVTTINDILCPNKDLTLVNGTIELEDGTTYTIPADADGNYIVSILDEENAPVGMDENDTAGEALFNRKSKSPSRYTDVTVNVLAADGVTVVPTKVKLYYKEDPTDNYSLFTIGEIEVNDKIMKNYSLIPLSTNTGSGDYDIAVCDKLTKAWQDKFSTLGPDTLTKNNFIDYYTAFIGEIANRGDVLNSVSTSQEAMVGNIDNQRMQVTGVSSDDELTNMIKFQHAYNAAARYVNVIDEMLEHIVTNL